MRISPDGRLPWRSSGRSMTPKDLVKNLTVEKSLAGLWWASRSFRSHLTPYYRAGVALTFVAVGLAAHFSRLSVAELGASTRKMSEVGFGFAGTTFGILLAGFAIFATIGTSDLARRLTLLGEGMSEIKRMALHFTRAFVPLLALCFITFMVSAIGFSGGPATLLANELGPSIARWLASASFAFISAFHVYVMIVLAAFVYNVHISLMTMVRARVQPGMEEAEAEALEQLESDDEAAPGTPLPPSSETRPGPRSAIP